MNSREITRQLREMSVPALHLAAVKSSDAFSKIGGLPTLPNGVEWPEWKGKPLSFLAQIDLAELPERAHIEGLPPKGRLFFFYDQEQSTWGFDPADFGSWRVLYSTDQAAPAPLVLRPSGLADEAIFHEKRVALREIASVPDRQRLDLDDSSNTDDTIEAACQLKAEPFQGMPQHQMGGYPWPVQNDAMELECQLVSNGLYCGTSAGYEDPRAASLGAGARKWKLLLQLDTDDDTSMMWGDVGKLYFWIRSDDLAKRDFSRVWMIMQCY